MGAEQRQVGRAQPVGGRLGLVPVRVQQQRPSDLLQPGRACGGRRRPRSGPRGAPAGSRVDQQCTGAGWGEAAHNLLTKPAASVGPPIRRLGQPSLQRVGARGGASATPACGGSGGNRRPAVEGGDDRSAPPRAGVWGMAHVRPWKAGATAHRVPGRNASGANPEARTVRSRPSVG